MEKSLVYDLPPLFIADGSEKLSDNSPGAASISSVDIANEFASLSHEEQERLRAEWSQVIDFIHLNRFQSNAMWILLSRNWHVSKRRSQHCERYLRQKCAMLVN